MGGYVWRDLRVLRDESARSHAVLAQGVSLINQLQYQTQETRRTVLYALGTADANEQVEFAQRSRKASAEVVRLLDDAGRLSSAPLFGKRLAALTAAWADFLVIRDEVIGLLLEGDVRQGVTLELTEGTRRFGVVEGHVEQLAESFQVRAAARMTTVEQLTTGTLARVGVLWLSALMGILSTLLLVQRWMAVDRVVQEEARRIALLEVMLDAVISVDEEGRVLEANSRAEETFGLERGSVRGRRLDELILTNRQAGEPLAVALARRSRESADGRIEVAGRRGDGSAFPLELRMVEHVVHDRRRFTAHLRDTTERQNAENELRRAWRAAEAASAAKGEFVATVSHEIRTPLNVIIGMISLLHESPLSPKQREWVAAGRASGQGLLSVLDQVLDLSRIESGHLELDPQPTDLRGLIEEVIDVVSFTASLKQLALSISTEASAPAAVVVDTTRVRQVLLNLLSNAVKFTERGGVHLLVSSTPARDNPHEVVLRFDVRDTGPGIAAEQMSRLFQSFSQGERSTWRKHGGSGLGLAISRQLARLLGGDLSVKSQLGVGSTFTLTCRAHPIAMETDQQLFSRADAERLTVSVASPGTAVDDSSLAARHPLRILLVEDDEANQLMLRDLLGHFGYDTDVAGNGEVAIQLTSQQAYDLILMDLQMPVLGGLEATEQILSRPDASPPRIVAVSANASEADRTRGLSSGMSGYLSKPVRLEALRTVLAETVLASRVSESLATWPFRSADA
jgi:PAS domain S-box-containing protein